MSAEPAVNTNAENPAGTAEKPAVRPAGPIPLPETDSSDAKKKRGSHRVMAAGGLLCRTASSSVAAAARWKPPIRTAAPSVSPR